VHADGRLADPHDPGDLGGGKIGVVVQDHRLPLVRREVPECAEQVDERLGRLVAGVVGQRDGPRSSLQLSRRDPKGAPPEPPKRRMDRLASREHLRERLGHRVVGDLPVAAIRHHRAPKAPALGPVQALHLLLSFRGRLHAPGRISPHMAKRRRLAENRVGRTCVLTSRSADQSRHEPVPVAVALETTDTITRPCRLPGELVEGAGRRIHGAEGSSRVCHTDRWDRHSGSEGSVGRPGAHVRGAQ
jgi:hypothetical protein